MCEFEFQFVLRVLFLVYEITGFLNEALQDKELEMDRVKRLQITTINALEKICTESFFEDVYNKCIEFANENYLEKPALPRIRKVPPRFRGTVDEPIQHTFVKQKFKGLFFDVI